MNRTTFKKHIGKIVLGVLLVTLVVLVIIGGGKMKDNAVNLLKLKAIRVEKEKSLEQEVYEFADSLSRKMPEDFIKSRAGSNGWIYHDKNLTVSSGLLLPGFPESGEGSLVEIHPDGGLSVCYWDHKEMKLIEEGKIDASDMKKGRLFGYANKNGVEAITIFKHRVLINYSKRHNKWMRQNLDADKMEGGMDEGMALVEFPVTSETDADKKLVRKYLDLIGRIRKTYPVD